MLGFGVQWAGMKMTPASDNRGYVAALASAAILSTTAVFIRHLVVTYEIPALVLAFWRAVFVVITLLAVLGVFFPALLRVRRADLVFLASYGLMLSLFTSTWTLSVTFNGAAVATVLAYTSAAFTALLGWWLLKERLDGVKLLTVGLCLGGCVLVAEALDPAAWRLNLAGIGTGVLSGLWYSGYSLMGRMAAQRGLNPWTTLLYTFGFAAVLLLGYNLVPGGAIPGTAGPAAELLWLGNAWVGWALLALLAAVPTVGGFGLYNVSLSLLPSSVVQLIATLEPAFTALIAYLLLGEVLNAAQGVGSGLILLGVLLLRLHEGRLRSQAAPVGS
jgi:drug/metabolite transporter (DMT)-like permease